MIPLILIPLPAFVQALCLPSMAEGAAGGHLPPPASQNLQKYKWNQVNPMSETSICLGHFQEPEGSSVWISVSEVPLHKNTAG